MFKTIEFVHPHFYTSFIFHNALRLSEMWCDFLFHQFFFKKKMTKHSVSNKLILADFSVPFKNFLSTAQNEKIFASKHNS